MRTDTNRRSRGWQGAVAGAALVGVVAVAPLVVQGDSPDQPPPDTSSGLSTLPGDTTRAAARKVYDQITGTVEQRRAGGLLKAHALNWRVDDCMADAGFPEWDWRDAASTFGPSDALSGSAWFSQPLTRTYSEEKIRQKPHLLAQAAANSDEPRAPGFDDAARSCVNTTAAVGDSAAEKVSAPANARALQEAWWSMLREADVAVAGRPASDYDDCILDARIPAVVSGGYDPREFSVDELLAYALLDVEPPATQIPDSAEDPAAGSAAWKAYLTVEDTLLKADWDCRRETYEKHIAALAPLIEEFGADHAEEIDAVARGWAEIEHKAATLPSYP